MLPSWRGRISSSLHAETPADLLNAVLDAVRRPVGGGSATSPHAEPPAIPSSSLSRAQRARQVRRSATEPLDAFAHPFWDEVRTRVAAKAADMRRQGFFGAAMLPMSELEYTGIVEKLATLDGRFTVRV